MTDYTKMTKEELINLCKEKGLATNGKVPVLISRLNSYTEPEKATTEEASNTTSTSDTSDKPSAYAINAMRPAIIGMHKINNARAISKQDAQQHGVSEEKYKEWVDKCRECHELVEKYCELKHIESTKQEDMDTAYGKIFPAWRKLVECGAEKGFHKNWFIRKEDVDSLVGYNETFIATDMGTQFGNAAPIMFRRKIESLIGCRIAANAVMTNDDRDTLMEFYKARNTVSKCLDRLNGTTNDKGEHTKGIIENIADLEKQIKVSEELLRSLGQKDEDISSSPILATFRVELKELEESKKATEKTQIEAEKKVKELQERANAIHANIKPIEED